MEVTKSMKIPLIKPYIDDEIKDLVNGVLDSGFLTEGNMTHDLEEIVRKYIGCEYAIAFSSCTTALETALRCLNLNAGDEVIVPDYTYPATAAVAPLTGAVSVIVDIDRETMLIDYDAIERSITSKTKAIIPVSLFGNPLDYDILNYLKEKYKVPIIEDAACSIGAEWNGKKVGNFNDMTVFSFHPRKFITTGEGGMLVTNNKIKADWINSFKHFGIGLSGTRETTIFNMIGTNYKLSNILSAVGYGQMRKINLLLSRRRELAENYVKLTRKNPLITLPTVTPEGLHSWQSFPVFIENRDKVMKKMREKGFEVQIGTYSLHMHSAFQNNPMIRLSGPFENSRWVFDHCLVLPLYHDLTFNQQEMLIEKLCKLLLVNQRN